ncbi:hypothetical protein Emed_005766 [Eimeria media]
MYSFFDPSRCVSCAHCSPFLKIILLSNDECDQTTICFLESDFTQLKHSLLEYCHLRQEFLTTYLHENARKEQDAIFDFVDEDEYKKVAKVHSALDAFEAALEAAETMLIRTKKAMKVDAEMLINSLNRRASELFKHFTTSAPFDGASFNYDAATAFAALQGYKLELSKLNESREQLAPTLDFFGIENNPSRDIAQMENDSDKLGIVWAMKAIRDRHWERIKMEVAERFDQHSDTFNLKAVFQYELLRRSGA